MFKLIKLVFYAALIFVAYQFHPWILTGIGNFFILDEKLEKADAIVVMSGDDENGSRVERAVELYKKDYGKFIILSGNKIAWNTYSNEIMLKQALALKVPEESILRVTSNAHSTVEEVPGIVAFLKNKGLRKVIIVTSDYHTRRTAFTFRHLSNSGDINIIMTGAENMRFRADRWWKERLYAKTFFMECCKLLWYYTVQNLEYNYLKKPAAPKGGEALLYKLDYSHFSAITTPHPGTDNTRIAAVS